MTTPEPYRSPTITVMAQPVRGIVEHVESDGTTYVRLACGGLQIVWPGTPVVVAQMSRAEWAELERSRARVEAGR